MPLPAIKPYELSIKLFDALPTETIMEAVFEAAKVGTTPTPLPIEYITSVLSTIPF